MATMTALSKELATTEERLKHAYRRWDAAERQLSEIKLANAASKLSPRARREVGAIFGVEL